MFFVLLSLSQLIAGILGAEKVDENASTSFHIDPLLAWKVSFAIVKKDSTADGMIQKS